MFPSLSPDNLTTIIVAIIAFASAYLTAKLGTKKSGMDTLSRYKLENETLKGKIKELEDEIHDQRNKTALEMKHRIEAQAQLEAVQKMNRRKRRKS